MSQERHLTTFKIYREHHRQVIQEYVIRYQLHTIDWNMRVSQNNAYGGWYPAGVS